jgi:aryl-alcohol dehydrogenase-like predicted oxidoreductase
LALGTVQFGLSYGVANRTGQVSVVEASAILDQARAAGVDTLDTAVAYGESEARLGEIGVAGWRLVSKLPPLPHGCVDIAQWARDSAMASLDRLRVPRLHALLLHRARDLLEPGGDALYRALVDLRSDGVAGKIGVSVYGPDELEDLWPRFQLDMAQAPFNIVDRRLASSGWLQRLHDSGAEIHVRSAFLQGLLLMDSHARPAYFASWQALWKRWDDWRSREKLSAVAAALGFVMAHPQIDRVVVGVDSVKQLQEILTNPGPEGVQFPEQLACSDPALINPSEWKKS